MHPMRCEAQVAWKCPFTPFIRQVTSKVSQTDLLLSVQWGFINRSV